MILLVPSDKKQVIRQIAFWTVTFDFILSIPVFINFNGNISSMQFTEKADWVSDLGISYNIGVDGISILLFMLATFLAPVVILSTWQAIEKN